MIDISEDELAELFALSDMTLDAATALFAKMSHENPKLTRLEWLTAYTETTKTLPADDLRIMLCAAIKRLRNLEHRARMCA